MGLKIKNGTTLSKAILEGVDVFRLKPLAGGGMAETLAALG